MNKFLKAQSKYFCWSNPKTLDDSWKRPEPIPASFDFVKVSWNANSGSSLHILILQYCAMVFSITVITVIHVVTWVCRKSLQFLWNLLTGLLVFDLRVSIRRQVQRNTAVVFITCLGFITLCPHEVLLTSSSTLRNTALTLDSSGSNTD